MKKRGVAEILKDAEGSATMEFAILAPILFLLLLAIFELAQTVFVQSVLDGAARDAGRLIRTGQLQTSGDPEAAFRTQLCATMSTLVSCSDLIFDVASFGDWASAQTALAAPIERDENGNLATPSFSAGLAGSIIAVRVTYNRSFVSSLVQQYFGGSAFLMSTVIFQNEPFGSAS